MLPGLGSVWAIQVCPHELRTWQDPQYRAHPEIPAAAGLSEACSHRHFTRREHKRICFNSWAKPVLLGVSAQIGAVHPRGGIWLAWPHSFL